jgi:uncharacterized membrane-anchored protein YjiN (DUF445 family)
LGGGRKPRRSSREHIGKSIFPRTSSIPSWIGTKVVRPSTPAVVRQKTASGTAQIIEKAKLARPVVSLVEASFPSAAPAIEVGYQIILNLDTVQEICRITTSPNSFERKLSDVTKLAVSKATRNLVDEVAGFPLKEVNSTVVRTISGELEKKRVFDELAESLRREVSSAMIKEFFDDAMLKLIEKGENELWKSYSQGD